MPGTSTNRIGIAAKHDVVSRRLPKKRQKRQTGYRSRKPALEHCGASAKVPSFGVVFRVRKLDRICIKKQRGFDARLLSCSASDVVVGVRLSQGGCRLVVEIA